MTSGDVVGKDLIEIAEHGLTAGEVHRQLNLLRNLPPYSRLDRPCTLGDGIRVPTENEKAVAARCFEEARSAGRLLKFVPASGAASRMFKSFLAIRGESPRSSRDSLEARAAGGDDNAREFLRFVDEIERFAFVDDLTAVMRSAGLELGASIRRGRFQVVLDYLLTSRGLGYAELPKGLLKFHRYGRQTRTPFEEYLVEAVHCTRDREGLCRLHFTVSPQHRGRFVDLLRRVRPEYEGGNNSRFEVGFSLQKPSSDTVAVDEENLLFRTADGRLLFRPGGHGSLIENLNDLRGDIVLIKNIDNVLPDYRKGPVFESERLLVGVLVAVQKRIFEHLQELSREEASTEVVETSARFASDQLSITLPDGWKERRPDERRQTLIRSLTRPLRVCAMVRNTGEPGGGPFWVRGRDGILSLQIVESAQVDPASRLQRAVFQSATHFNPVDLVCGLRDRHGTPFDLTQFVDEEAVFISEKSQDGRRLRALERPGLWNGAMADWNTIFVEVPVATFSPVKTVTDLLRAEHQPEED